MVLARADLEILKQLMGAGERGHNVSELGSRITLDRLAKGGFVVAVRLVSSRSNIASHSGAETPY
jgi:hypothetical protein